MDEFKTLLSVKKLMNPHLVKVNENITVTEAATVMLDECVDSVLITNGDLLKGILTETDIVRRVVAKNIDPKELALTELNQENLLTINSDESIFEARKIMEKNQIHHLIVTEEDSPIGIVAARDVIKA
ncbi:MAG: cyclic nucleotide-binding/CBS domain-containing protein [Nitrospinota bacterium]